MTILAIVLGLIPLVLGGILNWIALNSTWYFFAFIFMGPLMFALWIALSYHMRPRLKDTFNTVILLNLFAIIFIILFTVQHFVLHEYLPNIIGRWPQLFFLPLTLFGGMLTGGSSDAVFYSNLVSFFIMILASVIGCTLRKKRQR